MNADKIPAQAGFLTKELSHGKPHGLPVSSPLHGAYWSSQEYLSLIPQTVTA